jgi:DNA-binding NtrC family response regulator
MTTLLDDKTILGSVLIIEDDVAIATILEEKLQTLGYQAIYAVTVRDAVQKLRNQRFSCVVLDMVLKDGSHGESLIPILESHWKGDRVPVVVTSGSLETELVKRIAPHVKAAFVKPYDFDAVTEKILDLTCLRKT